MMLVIISVTGNCRAEPFSRDSSLTERSAESRIPTEKWAVRLRPGEEPDNAAKSMGAENLGQIAYLPNTYLFRFPDAETSLAISGSLKRDNRIEWYEQQVARWRFPKGEPETETRKWRVTDPLFPDQWHLENKGQSGGKAGEDVNVTAVWNQGITGSGVVIGVVDDGLQYEHPDIELNYREDLSYDFNGRDNDPYPFRYDAHGTSAAGVAAARDNDTCGAGAAYRAGLAGLRLIGQENTDADEADCLSYKRDDIHIYSNSWGPDDDGKHLEAPGDLAMAAIEDNIKNGRGGLGTVYVWAAGNGLNANDNVNYDGYANSRFTIAVGAVGDRGQQADYSEPGAAMLITAPSDIMPSGGTYVGITTTDLLGSDGDSSGDCTDDFGGTSASAPLAAGVIALMLEANPNLTWRDIQHILVKSATQNDPQDEDWTANSAGLHINHKYGFGLADAEAGVRLAFPWQPASETTRVSYSSKPGQSVPDNDSEGVSSEITVEENLKLEHVEVVFNATHAYRGDLQMVLTAPSGTKSILAESHKDKNADYDAWKFMTVRHWNEFSGGKWTLTVADLRSENAGKLDSWELILYGTQGPAAKPDAVFTEKSKAVSIEVLDNDRDPDGDTLKLTAVSEPAYGTAVLEKNNMIIYTPNPDFSGIDVFTYTVSDDQGGTDTDIVSVTVASDFALSFNGENQYAECGNDAGLNLTGPLTIEAWINPSGWGENPSTGFGRIVDKEKFLLYLNNQNGKYNDHSLVFGIYHAENAFSASVTPENSVTINQWQHVAVTYDGVSDVKMYINGKEQILSQEDIPSGSIADNSEFPLLLGESGDQNRAFQGVIDEVRLWNQVRTVEEIQSAIYTRLEGTEEGLTGYWPMISRGDTLPDASGKGLEGTIFGATWVPGVPLESLSSPPPGLDCLILALKILAGTDDEIRNTDSADIDDDGKVDMTDAIGILQKNAR
jgi:subtilisin-like proprotein convertase family protein